jgi:acetate kinase
VRSVLCINAGSSSLKAAAFRVDAGAPRQVASVLVEGVTREAGRWALRDESGDVVSSGEGVVADHATALHLTMDALTAAGLGDPDAIGHRVVHGGTQLVDHAVLDAQVLALLRAAVPFAPLHLPSELEAIDVITARAPGTPQVVCLDTAFHRTMPPVARRLPLPAWVDDEGIRRFGFHGLSYEYLVHHVGAGPLGRAVVAHLGSGASLAAIVDGRSIDTTMGFTPAGGIVMATRPGDLDPGTLIHLARTHGLDPNALEALVNHESGLLGLSGHSADMVELTRRAPVDAHAALAIEAFCVSAAKAVGALATVLRGLDTIVFTGGVGEHAADVRAAIVERVAHLGVTIDAGRNGAHAEIITTDESPVTVRVVATDENLVIARTAVRLLR